MHALAIIVYDHYLPKAKNSQENFHGKLMQKPWKRESLA